MPELNANIPAIECFVRGNHLRNQKDSHDLYFPCVVFAVASLPDRAPLFHFIMEDGGIWWRAPLTAFCHIEGAPEPDIHDVVLWNSFSSHVTATEFTFLKSKRMSYLDRHKNSHTGNYLFTLDWHHPDDNVAYAGWAQNPGQHKCGHVIELDNGNYAIQPNNRILAYDPSFTTKAGDLVIERHINEHKWDVENGSKWLTEDNEDNYMYTIQNVDERNNE